MIQRIIMALVTLALLISPAASAQEDAPPPPVTITHLTGPLHLIECNGNAHMVASIGEDGTLLVDTGYAGTAEAVAAALDELGAGPVRVIVNTHGDPDHVGGNAALGTTAQRLAHPWVRGQMGTFFALSPRRRISTTLEIRSPSTSRGATRFSSTVPVGMRLGDR